MKAIEFIRWLKNHHAYRPFIKNFNFQNITPLDVHTMDAFLNAEGENAIDTAFSWDITNEGFDFWFSLDSEFCKFYKLNYY